MSIINITNEQIINYCGFETFDKAKQNGSNYKICLKNNFRNEITAIIQDNFFSINFVQIIFEASRILSSYCSCEQNKSIPCVHIALLLLAKNENCHRTNTFKYNILATSFKEIQFC